jgi:hypothetical protein
MENIVIVLLIDYVIYVRLERSHDAADACNQGSLYGRIETHTTSKLDRLLRSLASRTHYIAEARP